MKHFQNYTIPHMRWGGWHGYCTSPSSQCGPILTSWPGRVSLGGHRYREGECPGKIKNLYPELVLQFKAIAMCEGCQGACQESRKFQS